MSEIVVTANEISFEQRERDLNELERKRLKETRKSPFTNFYQVNKDSSNYLRSCLKENPRALELLLFIFDHMDKYNAVICSYKVFQEALGVGQATIARAIITALYTFTRVELVMSTLPTKTWSGIPGEQISNTANFLRISYYQKANRKSKSKFAISVSKRFKSKEKNKFERHCRPLEQRRIEKL